MAMRLEIRITMRRVYPNCDPPAKSVAQFPGSIYPTEIRNPGPANASSFLQNPNVLYTGIELCTSSKLMALRVIYRVYMLRIQTSPQNATGIGTEWRPLFTERKHFFLGWLF